MERKKIQAELFIKTKLENEMLTMFKKRIRRTSCSLSPTDLNKLTSVYKREYVNMVREKSLKIEDKLHETVEDLHT